MRSVGVAVHMASRRRPTARVVVLDGSWGAAAEIGQFELTSNKDDFATVLHELASALTSHLSGLGANRVVIRRADLPPRASNAEGPRLRLLAEGALAGAARAAVRDVLILAGKELGQRSAAGSKEALDQEAAQQAPNSPNEAAAAALSGLIP